MSKYSEKVAARRLAGTFAAIDLAVRITDGKQAPPAPKKPKQTPPAPRGVLVDLGAMPENCALALDEAAAALDRAANPRRRRASAPYAIETQTPTQHPTMNTETPDTPPSPLSNAEAVQILTDGRFLATLTPRQKDAVLRAVHLVARRVVQKERNDRNRRARAEILDSPLFAQTPAPLSPDAPPCVPAPETNPATETEAANE